LKIRAILALVVVVAILGVVFYAVSRPKPTTPQEARPFVWDFDMEALQKITIALPKDPREPNSMSWVKHDDRYFYFDEPNGPKVDMKRWGGGIPLILSGPAAERLLFQNATDANLKECGFNTPSISIQLTLNDNKVYDIEVADQTPSAQAYYIRLADTRDIYTVDYSWYDVVAKLVTDPPYAPASIVVDSLTVTPLEARVNQTVNIAAEMVNNGTVKGTADVRLKVNGEIVQTKQVELTRDQRQIVLFIIQPDKAGTYSINVEGKTAKLVVK